MNYATIFLKERSFTRLCSEKINSASRGDFSHLDDVARKFARCFTRTALLSSLGDARVLATCRAADAHPCARYTHFARFVCTYGGISERTSCSRERTPRRLVRCIPDSATKLAASGKKREIISGGVNEIPNERRGTPGRRL